MFARQGLMLKDMSDQQRRLAHDLLRTALSTRGYSKVTAIIQLEDVLKVMEAGGRFARNKEEYLFSVFGTPGPKGAWGWRVESHHVSLRLTIQDGSVRNQIASSPMFLGSNPAEVRDGPQKGLRILGEEEDAARALDYRIQGPTFLVEFDNTQNDGNHVHSVWRDFNGDFGRDILRDHLAAIAH